MARLPERIDPDASRARSKHANYAAKDAEFARRLRENDWPSDDCPMCRNAGGGCCRSYSHHLYDCCCHCGNDERNIRTMKFRGAISNVRSVSNGAWGDRSD